MTEEGHEGAVADCIENHFKSGNGVKREEMFTKRYASRQGSRLSMYIQYDNRNGVMATSSAWGDVVNGNAIEVWSMGEAIVGVNGQTESLYPCLDTRALLFTLPPFKSQKRCLEHTYREYVDGGMSFVHVGKEGWFLVAPCGREMGLLVYNLHTRSVGLHLSEPWSPVCAVAAHNDVVVVACTRTGTSKTSDTATNLFVYTMNVEGGLFKTRDVDIGFLASIESLLFSDDGHFLAFSAQCEDNTAEDINSCLSLIQTSNWSILQTWIWHSLTVDPTSAFILTVDASSVVLVEDREIWATRRSHTAISKIGLMPIRPFWTAQYTTSGFYLPGLGVVCGHSMHTISAVLKPEVRGTLKMSQVRVAWLHAVHKGCLRCDRVRTVKAHDCVETRLPLV